MYLEAHLYNEILGTKPMTHFGFSIKNCISIFFFNFNEYSADNFSMVDSLLVGWIANIFCALAAGSIVSLAAVFWTFFGCHATRCVTSKKTAEREATGSTVNRNFKTTTFK